MLVLGLTGSIGMGKSHAARVLARHRVPSFDADDTVHRLLGPKGQALPAVTARFGAGVVGPQGVDRAALRKVVFGNSQALRDLEGIIHPLVAQAQRQFLGHQARARRRLVALNIPLLLETGGAARVDRVAVITAPARVQRARVLSRPGMSAATFKAICAQQLPDREKRRRADVVITSGLGRAVTERQLRRLVRLLKHCRGQVWSPSWGNRGVTRNRP